MSSVKLYGYKTLLDEFSDWATALREAEPNGYPCYALIEEISDWLWRVYVFTDLKEERFDCDGCGNFDDGKCFDEYPIYCIPFEIKEAVTLSDIYPREYYIYRYYAGGRLVYVGITSQHPYERYKQHLKENKDFLMVDYIEVGVTDDEANQKVLETLYILTYDPMLNKSDRQYYFGGKIGNLKKASPAPPVFYGYTVEELREAKKFIKGDGELTEREHAVHSHL